MIKNYAVTTEYKGIEGSGVLVKVDTQTCYLFTARHNCSGHEELELIQKDINELKNNLSQLQIQQKTEKLYVEEIVYNPSDNLDLIIFKLKSTSEYIQKLPITEVLKDENINMKYSFFGYPTTDLREDGIPKINLNKIDNIDKNHFRLKTTMRDQDEEKGLSGSGVFVTHELGEDEDIEKINYLVGIVIKANEAHFFYTVINLANIIDEINEQLLSKKVFVKSDVFDIDITKQIYTKIMNRNKNYFMIKKIKQILGGVSTLSILENNPSKLNEIIEFLDLNESELVNKRSQLADMYLLCGYILNSNYETSSKSTKYFNMATKLNSNFRRYKNKKLNDIYDEKREKENYLSSLSQFELANLKLYMNELEESEELFQKIIENGEIENIERIEIYNKLIELYSKQKNYDNLIQSYKTLINILPDDSFEKIELYSKLSEIYHELDNFHEADRFSRMGLTLMDTTNSTTQNKEVELRLLEQLNRPDEVKIRQLLEELVKINPSKYLDKYMRYSSVNNNFGKTNNEVYEKVSNMEEKSKKIYDTLEVIDSSVSGISEKVISNETDAIKRFESVFWIDNIVTGIGVILAVIILGIIVGLGI